MQEEKKETILKEIAFWKTNKLLPEHYCDFLTTLYTGGDDDSDQQDESAKRLPLSKAWILYGVAALLAMMIIAMMYIFSAQYIAIPIAMSVLAIAVIIYMTFKGATTKVMQTLAFAVAALLLFALSVRIASMFAPGNIWVMYSVLVANCVTWLLLGTKMTLIYFTISGYLGLAVIILFGFFL
ncbi:cation transport ATPase [Kurthia huakuii]|uniref:hypothetical protein n=1 Tax=Kurthia huakuii TaxID=1421019 RepID=UPI000495EEA3|nr:hypothetical protein [Kurthia huakuii]MBM7697996.1 cation transport ATPase [Kurthia huakuii]